MIWNLLELLMYAEVAGGFTADEIGICDLALAWL